MAPEILENAKYDFKADIGSLGMVFYEMSCFTLHVTKIMNKNFEEVKYSKDGIEVLKKMIEIDPNKRISIEDLLKLNFFAEKTKSSNAKTITEAQEREHIKQIAILEDSIKNTQNEQEKAEIRKKILEIDK